MNKQTVDSQTIVHRGPSLSIGVGRAVNGKRRLPFVLSAIALSALGAAAIAAISCGGDGAGADLDGGTQTPFSCSSTDDISVESIAARPEPGWFEGKAGQAANAMTLRVELNEVADSPMKAGEYGLGSGPDSNYGSCQHCAILLLGADDPQKASKVYFAVSGTMKLDQVTSPVTNSAKGSLSNVVFGETTYDSATGATKVSSSGRCYRVTSASWDTSPKAGAACTGPADCGDPIASVCDPATGKCIAQGCDPASEKPCDDSSVCLVQSDTAQLGACYKKCVPFEATSSCASGFVCSPIDSNQIDGKCVKSGAAKIGEDCTNLVTNTGCEAGLVCAPDGDAGIEGPDGFPVCRQACDFFSDTPACLIGTRCMYGGYCSPLEPDPAAIDEACLDSATEGQACGAKEGISPGVCVQSPPHTVLVCRNACRVGSSAYADCDNDQVCKTSVGESGIPACQPVLDSEEASL